MLGIGRATAKLFAKEGCRRLAIADIQTTALNKVRDEIQAEHKDVEIEPIPTGKSFSTQGGTVIPNTAVAKGGPC